MRAVTVKKLAKTLLRDHEVLMNREGVVEVEGDYHPGPKPVAGSILLTNYSRHAFAHHGSGPADNGK